MGNVTYQSVIGLDDMPTFHDAELVTIDHRPTARELRLRFRRTDGGIGTFRFTGVISQRVIDFAAQNVVSRLLISPAYAFSAADVCKWLKWMNSREDFDAGSVDGALLDRYLADFDVNRKALFVLEPSCGAEVAVLCEAIGLSLGPEV
ncbi:MULTISPECIES: hypothetical protein [Burkholderia]|uniref:hypothetical protein n=1 Tax=Burkholderia TaxID=32008 RepID=UPI00064EA1F0|nr:MULTISPECIES: hypothetical protein [Burkholderia]KML19540.1 hypothetical protein VL00_07170 [Burkholderia cepacia]KML42766.1 hypothetical protein VL13_09635 [Burkholderia lata]KMN52727.1 hypothetical protein VK92_31985 [Burkholderia sp. LK4]UQO38464.1 hypothetical protein L0Z22_22700 [Burkholderia cepacia]UQO52801.1 hypothetical protein L0Z05_28830 [Burkholderia cepacia]